MSQFVVSARKYRPQRFADVVGQAHVSQTLKNALRTEHVAHAFLFCGPRGVGKTTNARILAKILNCTDRTSDFEACGQCESCKAFEHNASFNIIELDAASNNSVEHIRELVTQVRFAPQQGKYKVFIIDEVHMLSSAAFNAFLKTLEEPPPYAIFILATTEKHKIIPTILSRCQIFDFRRIQIPDIVEHLQMICKTEGLTAEPDALHIIAQKADGALRDALSIFDRIVSGSDGKNLRYIDVIENLNVLDYDYYFKMTDALLAEDVSQVMLIFDDVMRKGFDGDTFVNGLSEHIRNILICKDTQMLQLLEVGDNLKKRYLQQATIASTSFLLSALNLLNECDINFKQARNKRLHIEMTLIKTAYISRAIDLATLSQTSIKEAAVLEKKTDVVSKTPASDTIKKDNLAPSQPVVVTDKHKSDRYVSDETKPPTADEPPAPSNESEGLPGPGVSKVKSLPISMVSTPKIGSIDAIAKMIEEEEAILAQTVSKLTYENLQESWKKFAATRESPSTKMALLNAQLDLIDTKVVARVGTELAIGFIQSELGLCDFMRFDLNEPQLTLEVKHDTSLTPEELKAPTVVKRYLTPREKLKMMMEVNPLVKDLAVKLSLKPDE